MPRRLPSLTALRAFEAAARHLSFTRAADELAVTQAAVSHQVKALEEELGRPLFRRLNRALELTVTGRAYLPALTEAFDVIERATRALGPLEESGPLKVSVLPSFAAKWLLPRLGDFRRRHPDIDVLVSAEASLVDLRRDEIDVGIRFGRGDYPGLKVELLMPDRKFPVCSPKLLEGPNPLRRPEDLRHHTLLHDEVLGTKIDANWATWLEIAGVTGIKSKRGLGFSDSAMVLAAAVAGQGVALSRASLANDDIAAGLLVQPFGPELDTGFSYYLVCLPEAADWPKVRAFREWIREKAEESQAAIARHRPQAS